ncbi:MAG: hypothetical protein HQK76_20585 [Desulfobacterales bacterium]|nr:hypothetical protein [Desulfobacterales bacterium]
MMMYYLLKIFGGVIAAFNTAAFFLIIFRDTPPFGGPPLPFINAIIPSVLSVLGFYLFITSDKKIKQLSINKDILPQKSIDWRGMVIFFFVVAIYIFLIFLC